MGMQQESPASAGKKALLLICLAVAVVGCYKVTGGGWLPGANGGKATFAFQGQCNDGTVDFGQGEEPALTFYEGQFQYHDKGANVSFHGDIEPGLTLVNFPVDCREAAATMAGFDPANEAEFSGVCISRPGRVTGTFQVKVFDNGKPGLDAGDEITVQSPSLDFFGQPEGEPCTEDGLPYSNSGLVGGGNITVHGS